MKYIFLISLIYLNGCTGEAEDCQTITPTDQAPTCHNTNITACCSGEHCYYLMDDTSFFCDGLECDDAVRQIELACVEKQNSP